MKKILLLYHQASLATKDKAERFTQAVQSMIGPDIEVTGSDIEDLAYEVSTQNAHVYHRIQGFDVKEFDLVVFRHVSTFVEEARTIAIYCEKNEIRYIDSYINRPVLDKVSASFLHWSHELPVPRTLFGSGEELMARRHEFGDRAIFKDNHGYKGELNFVVSDSQQMQAIMEANPGRRFLLQEFIPNDSDLRILIFNFQPVLVIRRYGDGSSHMNNTSQGGSAEIIPLEQVNEKILDDSVRAARAEKLEVAGVDIIINSDTGEHYILEVNQAPQISSGSFVEEKTAKYVEMLQNLVNKH